MKVLVTGGGGFIGSHLCEFLTAYGHEVRALVRYNSRGDAGWLDNSTNFKGGILRGDLRDYDVVEKAMLDCEAVIHLAAMVGIPYSFKTPLAYIKTNVEGTYNVLESAYTWHQDVKRIIVVSSSEVFGEARAEQMDESHPRTARSPYAASKIAVEELAFSYRAAYGLPVIVARPFNVFGPRQSLRAFIPSVIAQLFAGESCVRIGNPGPRRDYTFVTDTCEALIRLLEYGEEDLPPVVNIGTGRTLPMGEIARRIIHRTGPEGCRLEVDAERVRPRGAEVWNLCCDSTLIRSLGWSPKLDFDAGLERTIEWMREHRAKRANEYHV